MNEMQNDPGFEEPMTAVWIAAPTKRGPKPKQVAPPSAEPLTMSSQEISVLVGKEHFHVVRDIRTMLVSLMPDHDLIRLVGTQPLVDAAQWARENPDVVLKALEEDHPDLDHPLGVTWKRDARGYIATFELDKAHTMTLVTGYDVKRRHAVVTRWLELESQVSQSSLARPKSGIKAQIELRRGDQTCSLALANATVDELRAIIDQAMKP